MYVMPFFCLVLVQVTVRLVIKVQRVTEKARHPFDTSRPLTTPGLFELEEQTKRRVL